MMPALQSCSTRRSRKYDPCRNTSPYDACLAREQIIRHEALTENLSTVLIGGSGTEFGKKYLGRSLRHFLEAKNPSQLLNPWGSTGIALSAEHWDINSYQGP